MTLLEWSSIALVCLLGAMSPGPSLAVVVRNTILHGAGGGLVASISHGVAVALYAVAVVSGLGVLITGLPAAFTAVQWVGAGFLLYLGLRSLRSAGADTLTTADEPTLRANSAMRDGFLVAFLNPKLAIFFLALFSQFLDSETTMLQKSIMVLTVGSTDILWYSTVSVLLSRPGILERLRASSQLLDRVFGVILIALAVRVVIPF